MTGGGSRTTVVIATRNRCAELLRTLDNLDQLRPRPPVVVVDNASSDDTLWSVADRYPHVRLLHVPRNMGAVARNLGVQCARTPYVAFCDDDSWWQPDALGEAERVLDRHPSVGLIAARTLVGSSNRPDPMNAMLRQSPLDASPELPGTRILGFTACSAIVRREAFVDVGGFSPQLFFVAEEKLLSYDLAAAGWQLVHVDSVVAHHHPSSTRQSSEDRRVLEVRNNALIALMRRPWPVAAITTVRLARRACRDRAARRALLGVGRGLPGALRHRHRVPDRVERDIRLVERHGG